MKQGKAPNNEHAVPEHPSQESQETVSAESALEELNKILASPPFTQAQRLSRFLRYTVDQFLHGEADSLKEYLLGTAVFDKDDSFDPRTDPIVRVEAGRLRARLKEYYAGEGREDAIIIELPKGSYAPAIRKRDAASNGITDSPAPPVQNRWKTSAIALALLLVAVVVFWGAFEYRRVRSLNEGIERSRASITPPELLPLWKPFITSGSKNYAIFGSPLFFASPQYSLFVRPHRINDTASLSTEREFLQLQERLGPLLGPRYDYTLMRDAIALHRLTAFMVGNGASLSATAAHEAVWDSIKDGNIIFLGAPRMNPLMKHLPVQQDFEWDQDQNIRNRNPQPGEQKVYSTPSHETAVSYAVIATYPGLRPDREILMLAAHGGPGTQAAVDYVTRVETVRAMNDKLKLSDSGERKHYQMLLRVYVDNGAPVKTEYITHHMIP